MSVKKYIERGFQEDEAQYMNLYDIATKADFIGLSLSFICLYYNCDFNEAVKIAGKKIKEIKKMRNKKKYE